MSEQDIVSICATIMVTSGYAENIAQAVALAKVIYSESTN